MAVVQVDEGWSDILGKEGDDMGGDSESVQQQHREREASCVQACEEEGVALAGAAVLRRREYPDRPSLSQYSKMQSRCYWLRAHHQLPWSEIASRLGLRHPSNAYDNAYRYSIRHRYPWPMVNAWNFGQATYIDRTNGLSWQKISRKRGRPMTDCRNACSQWAKRHGYRWPPFMRSI